MVTYKSALLSRAAELVKMSAFAFESLPPLSNSGSDYIYLWGSIEIKGDFQGHSRFRFRVASPHL